MTTNRQTRSDFFTKYKSKKNLEINEVWRLREILNNKYQGDILILLINKMLYFNNTNKLLNNDGEFYKPREEMKMDIGIAPDTITNNLKKLQKAGWLVFENKPIENNKFRWSLHFLLNTEKIENEILENGEVNLNNKYWELRGDYTPNNKTKSDKKANPIKPVVKSKEKPTEQNVEDNTVELIEEPTEEIKPLKEPLKRPEDIRQGLDEKLDNRAKAKAIIANKTNPKINDYLDKLKLTNYDIHFLLSSDYVDGSDGELDDKKRILNLIVDNLVKVHI